MLSLEKSSQLAAVLECLKAAYVADAGAIHSLMAMRVPTNGAMMDHPEVTVRQEVVVDYISLSPLGIINGLLTSIGLPRICMRFDEVASKDADTKFFKFSGFDVAAMEVQPDSIQKEMTAAEKFAAVAPLPTPDQKLWEFMGLAMQADIDFGGKYDKIVSEVEEYFGVVEKVPVVDVNITESSTTASKKSISLPAGHRDSLDPVRAALQELVDTKNMKDSAGKTPEYEARRLAAWEQAEKVITTNKDTP